MGAGGQKYPLVSECAMNDSKPRRKLAAILAADVVNFSMLMGENEDRTLKNPKACADALIEGLVKAGWEPVE